MDRHRQEEPGAGRPVDVEVLLLRRTDDGGLAYRVRRSPLHADDHPDLAALLLAGCCSPAVSHSTSWRAEDDTLVLTYAVVPDPDRAEPALPLPHPLVVWSGDPFSVYTLADEVFVDGALVFDRRDPRRQPASDLEAGLPSRGAAR